MDLERALVSKIIFTGQIDSTISREITEEHFVDDECRRMYEYTLNHARRYKSVPSLEAAKHDNPDFEFIQVQEPIDYILDRFTVLVTRRLAQESTVELAKACDDPDRYENIAEEFLEVARKLVTSVPTSEIKRFSDVDPRIKDYEELKLAGKPQGIPYGYPTLDRLTGGCHSHELVTVLGFTNAGKSTLLRSLAFNFWCAGYTPLYISLEMEADVILQIFDAMAANLNYNDMKRLNLSDSDMKKWRQHADEIRESVADIPVIDNSYRATPDQVFAQTLRHKPDVVIVDYVGLMRSSSSMRGSKRYQQLSDITQDLKINARMLKIPVIMAAQTNRGGAKDGAELENVGDSISIAQDSDTVFGLFQDEDMEQRKEMELRVIKNRLGPRGKFVARWDFDAQFFGEKTNEDQFRRNGHGHEKKNGHQPEIQKELERIGRGAFAASLATTKHDVNQKWANNTISGFSRV